MLNKETRVVLFLIVISVVMFLGFIIELFEFTGHIFLGEREGLFLTGAGDEIIYADTMIVNLFGAIAGASLYYAKPLHEKMPLKSNETKGTY